MNDWLQALHHGLAREPALLRVVVASVKGSAPREPGACMLVGGSDVQGSIGGGHLELKATGIARQMLSRPAGTPPRLDRFALGATLGQCCGGAVNLWFERYDAADMPFVAAALAARTRGSIVIATELNPDTGRRRMLCSLDAPDSIPAEFSPRGAVWSAATDYLRAGRSSSDAIVVAGADGRPTLLECAKPRHTRLWLFGAGHVGRAVVGVFADLPFDISWIDSREDAFPSAAPANVTMLHAAAPAAEVACAPQGAWFLVMTHSHDLDYDICRAILARDDHAWAGLIGSETKATCFAVRLAREGMPAEAIARLTCPIGTGDIRSKLPGAIAVSVATQLLQVLQAAQGDAAVLASADAGAR